MEEIRYHSVRLAVERCKGCTNCLKHCPTDAIRVRGGRAHIINEMCIDCGRCIQICEHHAKIAVTDDLGMIRDYIHPIALPAPSLYSQFKELRSREQLFDAFRAIGFDDVFEVAVGADVASCAIRERIRDKDFPKPVISSACPAVVRLIQVRCPDLIDHIVDVKQPMEVAAIMAREHFSKKYACAPEDIGIFFITPCPAKMTAIHHPIGHDRSAVDGAISFMDIYGRLLANLKSGPETPADVEATSYGVGWGVISGEGEAVRPGNVLCVDGIKNVIRVLEEIENENLPDLDYFEGNACVGGCVGGALTFENNYIARNALKKVASGLDSRHPDDFYTAEKIRDPRFINTEPIEPNTVMKLDDDIVAAMRKLDRINDILLRLPGYDCGSCGSPTCRTFAEDIVRGQCTEMDCIQILKDRIKDMAEEMLTLAQSQRE